MILANRNGDFFFKKLWEIEISIYVQIVYFVYSVSMKYALHTITLYSESYVAFERKKYIIMCFSDTTIVTATMSVYK